MSVYFEDQDCTLHLGDCQEVLKTLPEGSINCCVTSPPYFGLRDYGHSDQIGLEKTPDAFVSKLVSVFSEVKRVLRDDGTLWLNLGDSYAGSGGNHKEHHKNDLGFQGKIGAEKYKGRGSNKIVVDVKPKDLIGIPWRVAFALQADGWYLRQDIIWHKPNPMPESVRDRCTKAHEYIFLLSKSAKYYYDSDSIREPAVYPNDLRAPKGSAGAWQLDGRPADNNSGRIRKDNSTRNKRSVWTVTPKPFKGAHFATFPPDLIKPCILAGCPEGGVVLDPFGGAGTTSKVCKETGRKSLLIELNESYCEIAANRIRN